MAYMARSMLDLSSSSDSEGQESVDEPISTVKLGQGASTTVKDGGSLRPTRKRASQDVIDRRVAALHANREKALQARREKALQDTERLLHLKQKEKALRGRKESSRNKKRYFKIRKDSSTSSRKRKL